MGMRMCAQQRLLHVTDRVYHIEQIYKDLLKKIPRGTLHLFPFGGHPAMLTNAREFAALAKDFFRDQDAYNTQGGHTIFVCAPRVFLLSWPILSYLKPYDILLFI